MGVRPDILIDLLVTALFLAGALSLLWERWNGKVVSGARETLVGLFLLSGAGLANILFSGVLTGSELLTKSAIQGVQGGLVIAGLGAIALGFTKKRENRGRPRGKVPVPVVREQIETASTHSEGFAQLVLQFLPQFSSFVGCRVVAVRFYSPRERRWGSVSPDSGTSSNRTSTSCDQQNGERIRANLSIQRHGQTMCEVGLDFASRLQAALASQEVRFAELLLTEELSVRAANIRDWYLQSIQEISSVPFRERGADDARVELGKQFVSILRRVLDARLVEVAIQAPNGACIRITAGESGRVLVEMPALRLREASDDLSESVLTTKTPIDPEKKHAGHLRIEWKETPRWIDELLVHAAVATLARAISATLPETGTGVLREMGGGVAEKPTGRISTTAWQKDVAASNSVYPDHVLESVVR